jgi:hypothetical protein
MRRLSLVASTLVLVSMVGAAQTRTVAEYERSVHADGSGPRRLAVDETLLLHGDPFRVFKRAEHFYADQGLSDLRLFSEGRPVPYLLIQPPAPEHEWIHGSPLSVAATKKTSGFEVDLGAARPIDMMRVEGIASPYLKRLVLEGSGDRERWTMLVAEGTLFNLPDESLRQETLAFAAGDYRYLRVTWNDANSGRVTNPAAVSVRRASSAAAPPAATIRTAVERRASEPGVSRFRLRLPAAALPIVALDLDIGGGHVYRRVVVSEARFEGTEVAPVELGSAMLARVTRDGATASALRIPIAPPSEAEIELTVEDGANAPLEIRGIEFVLAQLPWIYFEAPAGAVVARYGDRALQRPSYDLEAVRPSIDLAKVLEARWAEGSPRTSAGASTSTASSSLPDVGPALDAAAFTHTRAIEPGSAGLNALTLDAHALAHSLGPAGRFADVRILDASNRQVPYLLERRNEPLSVDLVFKPATEAEAADFKPANGTRKSSVYIITMPDAELPSSTLVVETSARVFQRSVRLGFSRAPDRHRRDSWFDALAAQVWRHADEQTPARALTMRIGPVPETDLSLVIDEGDNAPLPISSVRLLLPTYRLRFYRPSEASLRLVYGRTDLQAPQYDLALLAPRVMGASASEVAADSAAGARVATDPLISPRAFWLVLGGAVVILLALIARLILRHE